MIDESIHLFEELLRIYDYPAAEDTEGTLVQNAGRNEVKLIGHVANGNRVPSFALVSNNDVGSLGQKVGDFTFTFVTPLGTYDYYSTHASSPFKVGSLRPTRWAVCRRVPDTGRA